MRSYRPNRVCLTEDEGLCQPGTEGSTTEPLLCALCTPRKRHGRTALVRPALSEAAEEVRGPLRSQPEEAFQGVGRCRHGGRRREPRGQEW